MKKIEAKIIADSISPQGKRITTYLLTYPRFIHGELMTHRLFSRNSASSRAIPFEKMVKMVEEDPFIPIAWQKDHKGMQGTEYFTNERVSNYSIDLDGNETTYQLEEEWLEAKNNAVEQAKNMNELGLTKQLCNRLLEPFMWHTVLVTATEWENFFELRCPQYTVNWYPSSRHEALEPTQASFRSRKDAIKHTEGECSDWTEQDWRDSNESQAEIHIQALAEAMWDAMNESIPKELRAGEWHIPFGDRIDITPKSKIVTLEHNRIIDKYSNDMSFSIPTVDLRDLIEPLKVKIATARCARLSYMTFDGEIDYEKDLKLHDQLLESKHFSPFEHCARAMSEEEYEIFVKGNRKHTTMHAGLVFDEDYKGWCNNFRGFIQYRYLIENKIKNENS